MTQPRDALAGATENVSRAPLDVARRQSSFTEPCFCAVGSLNADGQAKAWALACIFKAHVRSFADLGKRTKKKGGHHGTRPYYIP